jgi:hypothetical protein
MALALFVIAPLKKGDTVQGYLQQCEKGCTHPGGDWPEVRCTEFDYDVN